MELLGLLGHWRSRSWGAHPRATLRNSDSTKYTVLLRTPYSMLCTAVISGAPADLASHFCHHTRPASLLPDPSSARSRIPKALARSRPSKRRGQHGEADSHFLAPVSMTRSTVYILPMRWLDRQLSGGVPRRPSGPHAAEQSSAYLSSACPCLLRLPLQAAVLQARIKTRDRVLGPLKCPLASPSVRAFLPPSNQQLGPASPARSAPPSWLPAHRAPGKHQNKTRKATQGSFSWFPIVCLLDSPWMSPSH